MAHYDVVICGAGISGLLLASELSKELSVVVLERNPRSGCSNKFWLTNRNSLALNSELSPYVDSEWNEMDFIASNRTKFTARGAYVLWNTKLLQSYLIDTIIANGSEIHYEHRFYSYRYTNDAIISYVNNRSFLSSLLIDCMGYSSPIVSSANAVSILGYHHLYGKVLKLKRRTNPIAIDNVILSGKPSYLEVFPRSDGNANVVLIASAKATPSIKSLKDDFNFIVGRSHYSDIFENTNVAEKLRGIVPVGRARKTSLDRILFFGEAGQVHPAASCTCLTKLLTQYKDVSRAISYKLKANQLTRRDLQSITIYMNRFSQRFHQNMFREMIGWTSDRGAPFVELLTCLDQKSLDDFIFGEITPTHFAQYRNLINLVRKGNFLWLKPLLQSLIT